MIGDRIREARQAQQLSLSQVASKAAISAATLSRIETNKQNIDLGLFLILARILRVSAHELIGEDAGEPGAKEDPLVRRIAALATQERTQLWRELAESRRQQQQGMATQRRKLSQQVEELVAQVEFLHEEILAVKQRTKR